MAILRNREMFASVCFEREICKGCRHNGRCDSQLFATPSCAYIDSIINHINTVLGS